MTRKMEGLCINLGMDLEDPSVEGTPRRLAKMYFNELCFGLHYENFPKCLITPNGGKFDEVILVRDITLKSLCEHHFMPVLGKAHIAYIPKDHILGLSKFNRIVDFFSRRPHLQERLGQQISEALKMILQTDDVAVIIDAEHFCVKFRGIQDECSSTVTSVMSGRFRTDSALRAETLSLVRM
jgi:GTP cyclohydrolase I